MREGVNREREKKRGRLTGYIREKKKNIKDEGRDIGRREGRREKINTKTQKR